MVNLIVMSSKETMVLKKLTRVNYTWTMEFCLSFPMHFQKTSASFSFFSVKRCTGNERTSTAGPISI